MLTGTKNSLGQTDVNLSNFPRPPFLVPASAISATVVDRLLDSGQSVQDMLTDSIAAAVAVRSRH